MQVVQKHFSGCGTAASLTLLAQRRKERRLFVVRTNDRRLGQSTCKVENCDKLIASRGLCQMHLFRLRRHGTTGSARPLFVRNQPTKDRLLSHRVVDPMSGCWLWTGATHKNGYGYLNVQTPSGQKKFLTHRLAASIWNHFPLQSSLFICHSCDQRLCFNPEHLFTGTAQDNTQDAVRKGRHAHGSRSGKAILNEEEVQIIRRDYDCGVPKIELANRFGVTKRTIESVVWKEKWTRC